MSEQPPKPAPFLKKIAGLFYRFDDDNTVAQIKDRSKSTKTAPVSDRPDEKDPAEHFEAVNPMPPAARVTAPTSISAGKEAALPSNPTDREIGQSVRPIAREATPPSPPAMQATINPDPDSFPFTKILPQQVAPQPLETAGPEKSEAPNSAGEEAQQPSIKIKYPPIVSFRNVSKIFNFGTPNQFTALKDVSFEIEDLPDIGEFIALVGPSGCGKSTVLNLIQGFQEVGPPTCGEILVRNKPVTGPGRDRGMIFQKYSSFPHLTVLQNVMFGLQLNRETLGYPEHVMEKLSREMIGKVGMKGHEDKFPYQLSGGQQQRVAIARTLVLKPRIILMDEPFSALDEPTRIDMQELITCLWTEVEATVFIVTHSLAEAVFLSDRIFMFQSNPGRLVRQIAITRDQIGKYEGMTPLEVQEGPKFKHFLKEITDEFLRIGGSE